MGPHRKKFIRSQQAGYWLAVKGSFSLGSAVGRIHLGGSASYLLTRDLVKIASFSLQTWSSLSIIVDREKNQNHVQWYCTKQKNMIKA